ncbi:ribosome-recycling factor, mitochondrial isoform X1 [Microtus oregoni]|uniref:ribosome-recycling factor, mitochondrial isoform X1 n=1 Tax=Microtus oregoni TaxID=111838 RepID=UPI001BB29699|nr:ribosome-recycling factor, mitochondrial isoform X1 [Microtus oregoni]
MALGIKCLRLLHPAFCTYLTTLTRPASEISMKPVHGRQHDQRQFLAYPAMPVRQFATKKAKAKGKGQPQARVNINTALVEDIINLEEVDEEMKSVTEALQDNFNKTLNIRTAPGSLDHITVVTADGKLALNHIGQISMKSPQLILVNMASFPECTAAAIKAIRESGMNLNPEVEGTLIRVPIPNFIDFGPQFDYFLSSFPPGVTREHREMLVKLAKQSTNKAKENLRKVRTNAMNKLKKSKDKASEDTIRLVEKQISQMADDTVAELDRHLAAKTKELLG